MENDELIEEVAYQSEEIVKLSQNIHATYNKIRHMNKAMQTCEKKLYERNCRYQIAFHWLVFYMIELIVLAIVVSWII